MDPTIQDAWRSVLGPKRGLAEACGLSLPFYDLGGDLLDAAQMASLIERTGMSVTLDDILDHPSLSEFSSFLWRRKLIEKYGRSDLWSGVISVLMVLVASVLALLGWN